MTPELEELKKLLAEAEKQSPLPWYTNGTSLFDDATYKLCDYLDPPEAALIVAAVNALPGLIARVEENERLREENAANRRLLRLYAIQHGTVTET